LEFLAGIGSSLETAILGFADSDALLTIMFRVFLQTVAELVDNDTVAEILANCSAVIAIFQDLLRQSAHPLIVTVMERLIGQLCMALTQHSPEDLQGAVLAFCIDLCERQLAAHPPVTLAIMQISPKVIENVPELEQGILGLLDHDDATFAIKGFVLQWAVKRLLAAEPSDGQWGEARLKELIGICESHVDSAEAGDSDLYGQFLRVLSGVLNGTFQDKVEVLSEVEQILGDVPDSLDVADPIDLRE
jgi:hypothetical protein